MRRANSAADPEDIFAETRMSFGDHLEDLRTHMIRALAGFAIGMAVSFLFGSTVVNFITGPVERQLQEFYNRRVQKMAKKLAEGDADLTALNDPKEMPVQMKTTALKDLFRQWGVQIPKRDGEEDAESWVDVPFRIKPLQWVMVTQQAQLMVGKRPALATMNVMEAFMVWVKVAAVTGLVLSSPWVFWQMWMFVAAGLYPHEKRYVHLYLPVSLGLFLAGVFVCEFLVLPKAIDGLLWFNEWLGLEPDLRLNEWLSFALMLPLVFGLAFQTPLVMLFLAKIGIFDVEAFRKKRRMAWFLMAIFSAVFTPVDAISMLLMLVPMILLYELGILMVWYSTRPSDAEFEEAKTDELVEI
jgi:sec-independent protein translocase protein TatC